MTQKKKRDVVRILAACLHAFAKYQWSRERGERRRRERKEGRKGKRQCMQQTRRDKMKGGFYWGSIAICGHFSFVYLEKGKGVPQEMKTAREFLLDGARLHGFLCDAQVAGST